MSLSQEGITSNKGGIRKSIPTVYFHELYENGYVASIATYFIKFIDEELEFRRKSVKRVA